MPTHHTHTSLWRPSTQPPIQLNVSSLSYSRNHSRAVSLFTTFTDKLGFQTQRLFGFAASLQDRTSIFESRYSDFQNSNESLITDRVSRFASSLLDPESIISTGDLCARVCVCLCVRAKWAQPRWQVPNLCLLSLPHEK